jgi:UTP-glucose-1-phosphate uridylyltransferase
MVGPISETERLLRVRRYLAKKQRKMDMKKFCYKCRKQVAEKRLRIKGRFVTKEQAFQILGLSQEELLDNVMIQTLLTQHGEDPIKMNSLIENCNNGGQMIKVRNFQALIDTNYNHSTIDGPLPSTQSANSKD